MGIIQSFWGTARLRITSAEPVEALSRLNQANIVLRRTTCYDPLSMDVTVSGNDIKKVKSITETHGDYMRVIKREGLYWSSKRMLHRPVLLFGLAIMVAMTLYLPGRIFFVRVEGNSAIPTKMILEQAEGCGIRFGATRRLVRSESMKNALLQSLPELQWAGINTAGCVATITVKEKTASDDEIKHTTGVSSIVASRDGVIQRCTVTKGNPLCSVGQAVKEGQMLVSGYTDCGLSINATQAEAEIYALTDRRIKVLSPTNYSSRGEILHSEINYSLQIGKNLINFFNNSGISDSTCVKIYESHPLSLPGGFVLPVSLIKETCLYYSISNSCLKDKLKFRWVSDHTETYLNSLMVAGQIIDSDERGQLSEDLYIFEAEFTCYEMIAQVKKEEIIQ